MEKKQHGGERFSVVNGYEQVTRVDQLDKLLNLVFVELTQTIQTLTERIDEQDKTIKSLRDERKSGGGGAGRNSATAAKIDNSYAAVVRGMPVSNAADVLDLITSENRERQSKAMGLVISGLPEGKDKDTDKKIIERALVAATGEGPKYFGSDVKCRRVGVSKNGKPPLVFVELTDKKTRETRVDWSK